MDVHFTPEEISALEALIEPLVNAINDLRFQVLRPSPHIGDVDRAADTARAVLSELRSIVNPAVFRVREIRRFQDVARRTKEWEAMTEEEKEKAIETARKFLEEIAKYSEEEETEEQ